VGGAGRLWERIEPLLPARERRFPIQVANRSTPHFQALRPDHASAVLAFELANRTYFAAFVSDRNDAFFDEFSEWYDELLAERETRRDLGDRELMQP
jgi:hypothetical protein